MDETTLNFLIPQKRELPAQDYEASNDHSGHSSPQASSSPSSSSASPSSSPEDSPTPVGPPHKISTLLLSPEEYLKQAVRFSTSEVGMSPDRSRAPSTPVCSECSLSDAAPQVSGSTTGRVRGMKTITSFLSPSSSSSALPQESEGHRAIGHLCEFHRSEIEFLQAIERATGEEEAGTLDQDPGVTTESYCTTCKTTFRSGSEVDHSGHQVAPLSEAMAAAQKEISARLRDVNERVEKLDDYLPNFLSLSALARETCDAQKKSAADFFDLLAKKHPEDKEKYCLLKQDFADKTLPQRNDSPGNIMTTVGRASDLKKHFSIISEFASCVFTAQNPLVFFRGLAFLTNLLSLIELHFLLVPPETTDKRFREALKKPTDLSWLLIKWARAPERPLSFCEELRLLSPEDRLKIFGRSILQLD